MKNKDYEEFIGKDIYGRWSNSMQWTNGILKGETDNGFEVYNYGIKKEVYIEYYAQISQNPYKINADIIESKKWKDRNYKNYCFPHLNQL
jgi:hypothetical protein